MRTPDTCRSCGASIFWLRTAKDRHIPVDHETVDTDDRIFDPTKHRSHFATCPHADHHRRRK